ncbi:phenylalanine--tRNA ligase subunit alpha, partial [Candidatus Parcubacteria bacterium]|nr:phenylalanine--tRNA ligase subunit alpha [Candidatus Parcubacteria bacterium]
MQKQFLKLKQEILDRLEKIKDTENLRDLEIKYLGRKGEFTKLLRNISALAGDEKRIIGQLANSVKKELKLKIQEAKNRFNKEKNQDEFIDITLPGKKIKRGHLHPITQLQNELEYLFISMGFMVLDGPELESDYYNFEALNI